MDCTAAAPARAPARRVPKTPPWQWEAAADRAVSARAWDERLRPDCVQCAEHGEEVDELRRENAYGWLRRLPR